MGMFDFTIENSTLATAQPWKYGNDYWCSFELYPEWTGNSLYVFKGKAYHLKDFWSGAMVAVKTFQGSEGNSSDWAVYMERCNVGRAMVANFNKHLASITCDTRVHMVKPIDAVMDSISDIMKITSFVMRFDKKFAKNEVVLFEDLLEGDFKTFVTALGETTRNGSEILDTFCHYTYHLSNENIVVCGLKGIEEEEEYRLTNPTIHSRDGCYGAKDKRDVGIADFFRNHICNSMCENFIKPESSRDRFNGDKSSTPLFRAIDYTDSKEVEASNTNMSINPPTYVSVDPHSPPPYDMCDK